MIYRSKAPLRIGFAGGGTDVSPYSELYGGAVLNAAISLYANTHIEKIDENKIIFQSIDQRKTLIIDKDQTIDHDNELKLLTGVYHSIVQDFGTIEGGLKITTHVDVPAGSGLGTSSTLVVSLIGAFAEMMKLPLGEYDIAQYAYKIEREKLNLAGGRQDQYAATFGGINFMEFYKNDHVIVNPLRIRREYIQELETNLVLFFTSTSRASADIIKKQQENVKTNKSSSIDAMHKLKEQSRLMKEAILKGNLDEIGEVLDFGFKEKKKMADNITNPLIEEIYSIAVKAGATGGKISGAGGGGFMIFYCPGTTRYNVIEKLSEQGGKVVDYSFNKYGLTSWTSKK
jgi:D-glycero-alpha-D-manno-heptose-7-phosphate kinase